MAKPVNSGPSKTDTFLQRQKQLASNVFEQTDYSGFRPIKKHGVDEDNFGHQHKAQPKGRKTADEDFRARNPTFSPPKQNYNQKEMVNKMLGSVFDKPVTASFTIKQEPVEIGSYDIPGRETKATK